MLATQNINFKLVLFQHCNGFDNAPPSVLIIGRAKRAHMGDTSGIFHILLYIIVRTSGFV